ncbi:MAG: Rne/Rng family ribonuclease [Proteobacteria bacterium]|nr:Rne/Rng family ribonuclease [Pseudomonadota bacterium]
MSKQILVNFSHYETRVATLENGEIRSLHIEREEDKNVVGNVYLGVVKRVLPGMQAAFLELGLERTAFLYVDDIIDQPLGGDVDILEDDTDATTGEVSTTPSELSTEDDGEPLKESYDEEVQAEESSRQKWERDVTEVSPKGPITVEARSQEKPPVIGEEDQETEAFLEKSPEERAEELNEKTDEEDDEDEDEDDEGDDDDTLFDSEDTEDSSDDDVDDEEDVDVDDEELNGESEPEIKPSVKSVEVASEKIKTEPVSEVPVAVILKTPEGETSKETAIASTTVPTTETQNQITNEMPSQNKPTQVEGRVERPRDDRGGNRSSHSRGSSGGEPRRHSSQQDRNRGRGSYENRDRQGQNQNQGQNDRNQNREDRPRDVNRNRDNYYQEENRGREDRSRQESGRYQSDSNQSYSNQNRDLDRDRDRNYDRNRNASHEGDRNSNYNRDRNYDRGQEGSRETRDRDSGSSDRDRGDRNYNDSDRDRNYDRGQEGPRENHDRDSGSSDRDRGDRNYNDSDRDRNYDRGQEGPREARERDSGSSNRDRGDRNSGNSERDRNYDRPQEGPRENRDRDSGSSDRDRGERTPSGPDRERGSQEGGDKGRQARGPARAPRPRNDRGGRDRNDGGRRSPRKPHHHGGRGRPTQRFQKKRPRGSANIQDLLKEGQEILVQVAKAPIGTKGARLTTHISLPGRNLVLMPTGKHLGISRRIESDRERRRLRDIFTKRLRPKDVGFIIRTVAQGKSFRDLKADAEYLLKTWARIKRDSKKKRAPALIHEDLSLSMRAVRDFFTEEVDSFVIDNAEEHENVLQFIDQFMPQLKNTVKLFKGPVQLFEHYGIEAEISRALNKKVWLKSGGYLLFDQSEALTAIDVNTGRYVGSKSLEETILKTNLEAVKEIAYQLRIRNIGGIIILDLIDMESMDNREKVYQALQQALSEDKSRTNILKISELGLVEMTRKRTNEDLIRYLTQACSYCEGRGYHKSQRTLCFEIFREIEKEAISNTKTIVVFASPIVVARMMKEEKKHVALLEERFGKTILVKEDPAFHVEQYEVFGKH